MAEHSVVPMSEIVSASRWDGEFFRPYFRDLGVWLDSICTNRVGDFASPSVMPFNPNGVARFNYVEISDIDLSTGETESSTVASECTPDRAQYVMVGGEILVSTVRPNRSGIGLLPDSSAGYVASSGFAPIRAKDARWRSFLFVWLKLQAITDWLDRHSKASMYPAVTPADILNVPVYVGENRLLDEVHTLVQDIERTLLRGKQLYPEAEHELLERLGWDALQRTKSELFFVANISAINRAERVDAEHFHPKYRHLRKRLSANGASPLGTLCTSIGKGTQPPEYIEGGSVVVVKSKNVFGQGIDFDNCERTTADVFDDVPARLVACDVVMNSTGFGTLGRAGFIPPDHPKKIVAAVDLLKLRVKREQILPEYLTLFLNSPAGLAQSEMLQTGSSGQLHLYPQHIREILVFLPRNKNGSIDLVWQKKLSEKVVGASTAKRLAQTKLAEAKRMVESAL